MTATALKGRRVLSRYNPLSRNISLYRPDFPWQAGCPCSQEACIQTPITAVSYTHLLDGINDKGEISEEAKNEVNKLLKTQFRPEFLNRLDEIVFYKPLRKDEISGIVDLMLGELKKRLADKEVGFAITDAAKRCV